VKSEKNREAVRTELVIPLKIEDEWHCAQGSNIKGVKKNGGEQDPDGLRKSSDISNVPEGEKRKRRVNRNIRAEGIELTVPRTQQKSQSRCRR